MIRRARVLASALLVLTSWPPPALSQVVRGRVVNAQTGDPVAGAVITLTGLATGSLRTFLTGEMGTFLLEAAEPGEYSLEARRAGFEAARVTRLTVEGLPVERVIPLRPEGVRLPPGSHLLLAPSAPAGQGRVWGRVFSEHNGRPVPDAEVVLGEKLRSVTDGRGRFRLEDVPAGLHLLEVRHLAYRVRSDTVRVRDQDVLDLSVPLGEGAIQLPPIVVTVYRDPSGAIGGFFERRDRGRGHFYTRDYIQLRHPRNFSDILRETPGIQFDCGMDGICGIRMRRAPPNLSGRLPGEESDCPVQYFIDGVHTEAPGGLDLELSPAHVEAVEVYRGASELPSRFHTIRAARCGAIVVWTRR